MSSKHRKLAAVIALTLAVMLGMATGMPQAMAHTTSQRLRTLESRVNALRSQMASVLARLGVLEARAPVPGPRGMEGPKGDTGDAGPAGSPGATGGSLPEGFWPAEATQTVDPVVLLELPYPNEVHVRVYASSRTYEFWEADQCYTIVTVSGVTSAAPSNSVRFAVGSDIPKGTPVTVEYWLEAYGEYRHETVTVYTK